MKTFLSCAAVCCVLISILTINSCSKKSDSGSGGSNNNNNNTDPAQSTPVGTPVGNATSKVIGPSGGTVTTDDGIISLVFPANAVSSNTTITIQPITNNCPGGNLLAYRFGPNGTKFSQPVSLQIHYPDSVLYSTIPELMGVAVQDSAGFWKRTINFSNDTTHRTISATIKHFTDYSMMELINITPTQAFARVNDKVTLVIQAYDSEDPETAGTADDFAADIKASKAPIEWAVNGTVGGNSTVGTIANAPVVARTAIYTAPASIPSSNPVTVTATASNLNIKYNGHTFNKLIAYSHVTISGGRYTVRITFNEPNINGLGGVWSWSDEGSFNVDITGSTTAHVNSIANKDATYNLVSNNTTCTATLSNNPIGPINILSQNHALINPATNTVYIIWDDALSTNTYIADPQLTVSCPGQQPYTQGGGLGPCFPAQLQFALVDTTQTMISGQYKIVVDKVK